MDSLENESQQNNREGFSERKRRNRAVSYSSRLRSASLLYEAGKITQEDKNKMKDFILCDDPAVAQAFTEYEAGNEKALLDLIKSGYLSKKSDFAFLDDDDLGLGELTLDSLSDNNSESIFTFPANRNNTHIYEAIMPDELMLDDVVDVRTSYQKRTRASVDYSGFDKTQSNAMPIEEARDGSTPVFNDTSPGSPYYGTENEREGNDTTIPSVWRSSSGMVQGNTEQEYSMHSRRDSTNEEEGMEYESMDAFEDTSSLTLSARPQNEVRRYGFHGLAPINTQCESQKKYIGIYSPESRKKRVQRFFEKRKQRVWTKKVKYDVRKNFADSRLRVKGRFVKKEDEELLREMMNLT